MADHVPGKVNECARHGKARCGRLIGIRPKQVRVVTLDLPDDRARGNAGFGEVASGIAPTLEVVRRGQGHAVGVDHRAIG